MKRHVTTQKVVFLIVVDMFNLNGLVLLILGGWISFNWDVAVKE